MNLQKNLNIANFVPMKSSKSSNKSKIKINQELFKSQDHIQSQSSHREVNFKKEVDTQAKEMLNFQREQMQNIRQKIFFKKVIKRLHALISLNKSPTDFTEEWERNNLVTNQKIQESQNISQDTELNYPWMKNILILHGFCLIVIVWMLSISVVFQQVLFTLPLLIFLVLEIIFLVFRAFLLNYNKQFSQAQWQSKIKKFLSLSLSTFACCIMLLRNNLEKSSLTIFLDIVVSFMIIILSGRVSSNFQSFRIYAQNKKVIKELRIIEMFCILFVIAHIFGLIIYSSIYITPEEQNSWIQYAKLTQKTWRTKYFYSIYWAITTIATVGYGDLTPQNEAEVIIILILQICGTSFFGYMINVIGITVDNINKKNVEYDNYQQTISKLKDHYQLSDQLCLSMKNDIKKKYEQSDITIPLKKNQETELLQFVDSTVKKNFILQTNIKIIKKSIFFLTYFTVNFQNQIALKLIRSIYKKDENIDTFDPNNKQRNIVIINHGKVSLYLKKRKNNSVIYKLVRTIQPIEGKPTLNVIGYSNLILNQNIDIGAVADQMTSGYVLKRSDVMQCIDKSLIDYQSLHQMRQKMLLISLKESIEAPSVKDSDFHFTPNEFILTCRHSKQSKQLRKKKVRRNIKCQTLLDQVKIQFDNDWFTIKKQDTQSYYDQSFAITKSIIKKANQFQSLLSIEESPHQNQQNINNFKENQQRQYLRLDQVKIFQHFMKNHNINTLAVQYEKCCKIQSYNKRILTKILNRQLIRPSLSQKLLKKLKTLVSDKTIGNNKK